VRPAALRHSLPGRRQELGGGFLVSRLLPDALCRAVGPFVFLDRMGPHGFAAGTGIDVRPHPHIGLATLTWLFEGVLMHRDSLGSVQAIRPGEVNWMVAGSGIVHSERTPPAERAAGQRLDGLQCWLALPEDQAECAPAFQHVAAAALPSRQQDGVRILLVAGEGFGLRSPVAVASPTLYAQLDFAAGGRLELAAGDAERAVYPLQDGLQLDGRPLAVDQLHVLEPSLGLRLHADRPLRAVLLGGMSVGPRRLWWNFVARDPERIEQAKADWQAGRFPTVPGEIEAIPLPES
jgi:redox-sensitive bicupin YhaK (pirin superfamily)